MMALVFWRDFRLDQGGINVECSRIDIDKDRRRPQARDATRRGEEREGWADHFVPRLDAQGHQGAKQRVGAAADADGVFGLAVGRQFFLESLDMGAKDQGL